MPARDYWTPLEELASRAGSWKDVFSSRSLNLETVDSPEDAINTVLDTAGERRVLFVTDKSFAGDLLDQLLEGREEKRFLVHKIGDESIEWAHEIIEKKRDYGVVCGFGGGRPIDISKMVASELSLPLFLVPTAPSHDGIASSTSSLLVDGKKKTLRTKRPDLVVVPRKLWENAPPILYKSGICDVISNVTALEDVSLSILSGGYEASMEHAGMSALAVLELARGSGSMVDRLGRALVLSGLSMESESNYGSGGEHEVEKALAPLSCHSGHPHGQLVGFGTLISSFLYSTRIQEFPRGLWLPPGELFSFVSTLMRDLGVLDFALAPWTGLSHEEKRETLSALSGVSGIRPERYTIWNVLDSGRIDFESVLKEIEKVLGEDRSPRGE